MGPAGRVPHKSTDSDTATVQSRALLFDFIWLGKARRPMVVFDYPNTRAGRNRFNAGCGWQVHNFGRKPMYAFGDDLELQGSDCNRIARSRMDYLDLVYLSYLV